MPDITVYQLEVIGSIAVLMLVAKMTHSETRSLLGALIGVTLAPYPSTIVALVAVVLVLRGLDIVRGWV